VITPPWWKKERNGLGNKSWSSGEEFFWTREAEAPQSTMRKCGDPLVAYEKEGSPRVCPKGPFGMLPLRRNELKTKRV